MSALDQALTGADYSDGTRVKCRTDLRQFEAWWVGTTGEQLDPNDLHITAVDLQE